MADEERPEDRGGWLPPSDRAYEPAAPRREELPGAGIAPASAPREEYGGFQPPAGAGEYRAPGAGTHQPGFGPGASPAHVVPTANGKATASLVLGTLGLIVLPLVCSVVALVLGYKARREIDASGGRQHNRGSATAGIITGWIGLVGGILIIVAMVAISGGEGSSGDDREPFPLDQPSVVLLARVAGAALALALA